MALLESPSYLGASQRFKACELTLTKFYRRWRHDQVRAEKILATTERVKMIYNYP